jgi:hypothetical protein
VWIKTELGNAVNTDKLAFIGIEKLQNPVDRPLKRPFAVVGVTDKYFGNLNNKLYIATFATEEEAIKARDNLLLTLGAPVLTCTP